MHLKDKVQYALDESRMLIMGVQVLLGFDLQVFFMHAFERLPAPARLVKTIELAFPLVAALLLLAPVARHRIVDDGEDTARLHRFTRKTTALALLPFSGAFALDVYLVFRMVHGSAAALGAASLAAFAALVTFYLLPKLAAKRAARKVQDDSSMSQEATKLEDKVRHVLTEARVVLPGTQALLGFQLVGVMQEGFEKLPALSKDVHLAGLGFLGVSVLFLMLPAAYHRIAEGGDISERLHRFSSGCVLVAMAALSLGLASATFVVVQAAAGSMRAALAAAVAWLALSLVGWFGAMLVLRGRRRISSGSERPFAQPFGGTSDAMTARSSPTSTGFGR